MPRRAAWLVVAPIALLLAGCAGPAEPERPPPSPRPATEPGPEAEVPTHYPPVWSFGHEWTRRHFTPGESGSGCERVARIAGVGRIHGHETFVVSSGPHGAAGAAADGACVGDETLRVVKDDLSLINLDGNRTVRLGWPLRVGAAWGGAYDGLGGRVVGHGPIPWDRPPASPAVAALAAYHVEYRDASGRLVREAWFAPEAKDFAREILRDPTGAPASAWELQAYRA